MMPYILFRVLHLLLNHWLVRINHIVGCMWNCSFMVQLYHKMHLTILLLLGVWVVILKIFHCVEQLAENINSKVIDSPFRSVAYFIERNSSSHHGTILQNLVYVFLCVCMPLNLLSFQPTVSSETFSG